MTDVIGIAGVATTVVGTLGGTYLGAWLARSSQRETLALQLQLDSAASFIGSATDFATEYAQAWAPDNHCESLSERHTPIFQALMTLESRCAAVSIAGPDDLRTGANEIKRIAGERGLMGSFDVELFPDMSHALSRFEQQARLLIPQRQKNGRSRLRRHAPVAEPEAIPPGQ